MAKKAMNSLEWSTVRRNARELSPLSINPRKLTDKQRSDLETSLLKFNLVEIPAINLDNTIIAGHQRLSILIALGRGDEEIDVRVPSRMLTESEVREYCIRSNKNVGEWNLETLKENFDLAELFGYGFTQDEFRELGLQIPDFNPIPSAEQPRLDQKNPITCPNCGKDFTPP
jgi:site-specific DNA-methyltransferase (adenine-specific)